MAVGIEVCLIQNRDDLLPRAHAVRNLVSNARPDIDALVAEQTVTCLIACLTPNRPCQDPSLADHRHRQQGISTWLRGEQGGRSALCLNQPIHNFRRVTPPVLSTNPHAHPSEFVTPIAY